MANFRPISEAVLKRLAVAPPKAVKPPLGVAAYSVFFASSCLFFKRICEYLSVLR
jgi:hypothetical protein